MQGRKKLKWVFLLVCLSTWWFISPLPLYSLHNHIGAHDPSTIMKCKDTYWIFTTGKGIYAMYSYDLVRWTAGDTPFIPGTYPSWVSNYVPGFEGHFWAPDCFYMNGKYHLYYSCSTWGSKVSAIGLVTNLSLNPDSPEYSWNDEGLVVSSNSGSSTNCIDPSVFRDAGEKVWFTYGSYFGGIRIMELDTLTGKPKSTYQYPVASVAEASYVVNHDNHYYLFINRGSCCQGLASTYHIQVGRSENPTGPFLDKNGTDLNVGGGTTFAGSSGRFIGPGHFTYYVENGAAFVAHHYYDGDFAGAAHLSIATVLWDDEGWPVFTRNWIEDGTYQVRNANSTLAWTVNQGNEGDPIIQTAYNHYPMQQWEFISQGDGFYLIGLGGTGLVARLAGCSDLAGTPLDVGKWNGLSCEIWRVERTGQGRFVLSSKSGNRVAEVPGSSTVEGIQLVISNYYGNSNKQWDILDTSLNVGIPGFPPSSTEFYSLYPNPVSNGLFYVQIHAEKDSENVLIELTALEGRSVLCVKESGRPLIPVSTGLLPRSSYIITVTSGRKSHSKILSIH